MTPPRQEYKVLARAPLVPGFRTCLSAWNSLRKDGRIQFRGSFAKYLRNLPYLAVGEALPQVYSKKNVSFGAVVLRCEYDAPGRQCEAHCVRAVLVASHVKTCMFVNIYKVLTISPQDFLQF